VKAEPESGFLGTVAKKAEWWRITRNDAYVTASLTLIIKIKGASDLVEKSASVGLDFTRSRGKAQGFGHTE
jgi:hypothetical protein